jgi:hypothetical protein
VYRNIRYTLDRTPPFHPLAVVRAQNQGEFRCCCCSYRGMATIRDKMGHLGYAGPNSPLLEVNS